MKEDVCPQQGALKGRIAPGPTYVADLKASWRALGKPVVGALGVMNKDEDVGE